jgi:hypothetical protein
MSNVFKIRLFFGVLIVCFFTYLSFLKHPVLDRDLALFIPLAIALQFFSLGYSLYEEKKKKNNDS